MGMNNNKRGNCYYTSEALYHILGGKAAGWKPMRMSVPVVGSHWFLKHESGLIIDATVRQFSKNTKVNYAKAKGCGFLTKKPSRYARMMIELMTYHHNAVFAANDAVVI